MRLFARQRPREAFDPVEVSEKKGVRYMHLGGHAVQSAMRMRDPLALELEYTRAMMCFLLFVEAPKELALIGLGGASISKFIHHHLPETRQTVAEINPDVVSVARAYFHLPADDDRLDVRVGDGGEFVRGLFKALDVLLIDGYDAQRIVEALASVEFYSACRAALKPGGVAVFNLWGSDKFFQTYLSRIGQVFEQQFLLLPSERKGNIQVFAFKTPLPELHFPVLVERAKNAAQAYEIEFPSLLDRMRSVNPADNQRFLLGGATPSTSA